MEQATVLNYLLPQVEVAKQEFIQSRNLDLINTAAD